ncbi:odorant receptor 13a-like [Diabrotica undecimpunctata]|uniref:odorant receptor 13a-like n=1 Tax=Diabrotica undecimpunctata TaxID=50387 RepID=UPI003B63A677
MGRISFSWLFPDTSDSGKVMLRICELVFNLNLMWPCRESRKILLTSCVVTTLVNIFVFYGIFRYIVESINEFDKITYALFMILLPVLPLLKMPVIACKSKEFKKLINQICIEYWPSDIMDTTDKDGFKGIYTVGFVVIGTLWFLGFLFTTVVWTRPLFFSEKTLPLPSSYPLGWLNDSTFWAFFTLQAICIGFFIYVGTIAADFLILAVCLYTANQFYILQQCFLVYNTDAMAEVNKKLRVLDKEDMRKYYGYTEKEYLVRCVKHHAMLLRLTKDINKAFSPIELGHLFITILGVCLGTFTLSNQDVESFLRLLALLYTIGFTFQLSIDCVTGNELFYQASLLPGCLFQSNWRTLADNELRKDVMFVIQHTQRIPQYTAYGLYDLNINSYIKVLKLAFSAYTFLTNVSTISKK